MHEFGYLGPIVNEASNGSKIYDPTRELVIADYIKPSLNVLGSAAVYNTVIEHMRATTQNKYPQYPIFGAQLPLDGHWDLGVYASAEADKAVSYMLGEKIPITLLVLATDKNPLAEHIDCEQERIDITPTSAVLEGWGDRPADCTLSRQQMSALAIDLRIAIAAYRQNEDSKKGDTHDATRTK